MGHLEISHHFCCFKPKVAIQMLGSTPAHCTQHHGVLRCSCRWNARSIGWNHPSYGTSPLQQQATKPPEFPTNFTSYLIIYAPLGTIFTDPWVSWSAKFGEKTGISVGFLLGQSFIHPLGLERWKDGDDKPTTPPGDSIREVWNKKIRTQKSSLEQWKKNSGCLGYIGDYYTTQLYGDYFINQYKDPY